jgi:hypothetical protein
MRVEQSDDELVITLEIDTSALDEVGRAKARSNDFDEAMKRFVETMNQPELPEFAAHQVVHISKHNTAHALDGDNAYMCDMGSYGTDIKFSMFKVEIEDLMTWEKTKDKTVKPWPAWPCQSCVRIASES